MRKSKKIVLIILSLLLSSVVVSVLSLCLILEPSFKISSFATLDYKNLSNFGSEAVFLDKYENAPSRDVLVGAGIYTHANSVNQGTKDAFIAAEDKRFYHHNGVDYVRIAGAALQNIKHMSYREGGSTITQQLIKNTHLDSQKTLKRKTQEIRLARELERNFDKDEILKMYLNSVYFGNSVYGIGTAARVYFDKDVSELTVDQSASLAGIINSPATYCPYSKYQNCISRRNLVLSRMLENKMLSQMEYEEFLSKETSFSDNNDAFNHYYSNAIFEAASLLDCDIWEIKNKKYTINTYSDPKIDQIIEEVYADTDFSAKNDTNFCAIVLDNRNAEVLSFFATGRKNYANIHRSPGSTIKPLIAYAPAIESGHVYPISQILDEKTDFNGYSPSNYKDKYLGWISVEDSLAVSSNVAAVKLFNDCGIDYCKKIAGSMGVELSPNDNYLALSLGGMEKGLTLQQVANAYQTFSRDGIFKKCSYIKSILDQNGSTLYVDNRVGNRAISTETAFLITDMLQKCVQSGTARQLKGLKNTAAKTGTVGTKEGNTDAYCISYTKNYTLAVWMGAKSGFMPNYISGGTLPSKVSKKIMSRIMEEKNDTDEFEVPSGIKKLYVDKEKLENEQKIVLANEMTPQTHKIPAFFDAKNLPSEISTKYFNKYLLYKDSNIFAA